MYDYRIEATTTHTGSGDTLAEAWHACHALAEQLVTDGERGLLTLHVDIDISFVYPADSGDPETDVPATIDAIRRMSTRLADWNVLYPERRA
jgi:hypothetical protein